MSSTASIKNKSFLLSLSTESADQLRHALAAHERHRRRAEVDQDHLDLAAVVGIDRAGAVEHGEAVLQGEPRARPDLRLVALGKSQRDAGRHRRALARIERQRLVERRYQIHAGGAGAGVARQDDVSAPQNRHRHRHVGTGRGHSAASLDEKKSAIRRTRRSARSRLLSGGQFSTPAASTRCTVLLSPPKVPVDSETSFARIQSQPFFWRLALAFSISFSVSAAKPTTSRGRRLPARESVARMSGFSTSASAGGAPFCFLSLCGAVSTRQSPTAAAQIAISAGSADSQAESISRAVTTWTTRTPGGSGSRVGPATSNVSAPWRASAAAIA